MDIDLSKVIAYSKDSLQSRALMRAIMLDLYPGKTREMNVLLDVYESGVPRQIKKDGSITDARYAQYIRQIVDDYGLQEQWAVAGLNAWIDVCLGKGIVTKIVYQKTTASVSSNDDRVSNDGSTSKGYTNPITHVKASPANNITVQGNVSEYEISDLENGNIEIKKFVGFDKAETVIPTKINGKKVIGIGKDAYKQCKGIKRLIVPEGIEYISEGAFAHCTEMSNVILPTSLKQLGKKDSTIHFRAHWDSMGAFQGTAITKIDLPNGITTIEDNSFKECDRLVQILFPDNLKRIGEYAFQSCDSLEEVILPSKVEVLEVGAFGFCKKLSKVKLNEGLKKIGSYVFSHDPRLIYLTIPQSITEFGMQIIGEGRIDNRNVTLGCYPGSKAIEYARLNNFSVKDATK